MKVCSTQINCNVCAHTAFFTCSHHISHLLYTIPYVAPCTLIPLCFLIFRVNPCFLFFLRRVSHPLPTGLGRSSSIFHFLPFLIYYSASLCYLRAFALHTIPFHPHEACSGWIIRNDLVRIRDRYSN